MLSKALIIPAAGSGKRMHRHEAKPFIELEGESILARTIRCFLPLQGLNKIVIATSAEYMGKAEAILRQTAGDRCFWQCVEGGSERQHSIFYALQNVSESDFVLVHDAVRPFVTLQQIEDCCRQAEKTGAAILGIPSKDTIKEVDKTHHIEKTPDRKLIWQAQTPQVFRTSLLKKAYTRAAEEQYFGTDDASLVEWLGEPVKIVQGDVQNFKITYPQDLELARILLKNKEN